MNEKYTKDKKERLLSELITSTEQTWLHNILQVPEPSNIVKGYNHILSTFYVWGQKLLETRRIAMLIFLLKLLIKLFPIIIIFPSVN